MVVVCWAKCRRGPCLPCGLQAPSPSQSEACRPDKGGKEGLAEATAVVLRVQPQLRAPGCIHVILEAVSPRPPFILENLTSTSCLYRHVTPCQSQSADHDATLKMGFPSQGLG